MRQELNQNKVILGSQYLIRLTGKIRLKVIIMDSILLVEGAILHWNWKGCKKIKLLSKLEPIFFQVGLRRMVRK